jgi:antitoxin component of MazEF toxin-antitoxin module
MIKKLAKHGNSYALVINKPIMELLGTDASSELDVRVEGKSLIVTPKKYLREELKTLSDAKLQKIVTKNIKKYAFDLKKLAKN